MKVKKLRVSPILMACLILGALTRLYNLNWGAPFYFHPDERNIASSIIQLSFPTQLNPHFFAYGSLPIYLYYFLVLIGNLFSRCSLQLMSCPVDFSQAIIVSRLFSAAFSIALIPLLFFVGRELKDTTTGIVAAFLGTTSIGFIQFAHFGTFEMWQTFFLLLLFFFCLKLIATYQRRYVLFTALSYAVLLSVKISDSIFILLPFLALCATYYKNFWPLKKQRLLHLLKHSTADLLLFVVVIVGMYLVTNPFVFLDPGGFHNSFTYESSVGFGSLPVFYTGEFFGTIPVLYQFIRIYPFLLNPFITLVFLISLLWLVARNLKHLQFSQLFLLTAFAVAFFPQAALFVKWTRYMLPTLPFVYLICATCGTDGAQRLFPSQRKSLTVLAACCCIIWALAFTITAYVEPDTREAAAAWARAHISSTAPILGEVYDLGIVPFNTSFPHITLFNTYDLDTNASASTPDTLSEALNKAEYFIMPSERVLQPRLENPKKFPQGYLFYSQLRHGKMGYQKVYETPCDLFCQITYLGSPQFSFEQTASVFDRPTVVIWKKNQ